MCVRVCVCVCVCRQPVGKAVCVYVPAKELRWDDSLIQRQEAACVCVCVCVRVCVSVCVCVCVCANNQWARRTKENAEVLTPDL